MKNIINAIMLRLAGAASVGAIMSSFTATIRKLEALSDHELNVSTALSNKADYLMEEAREYDKAADEAADRSLEARAKAQRIKELIG